MKKQDYAKVKSALRYWLLGKKYHIAHAALEFGLKHHTGIRKDGIMPRISTPKFSQANFARTLEPSLMYPEETITTILLHDTVEDTPVTIGEIVEMLKEAGAKKKFIKRVVSGINKMTNQWEAGVKKPADLYYGEQIECPIASIAKGCDRIHNHQTMSDAFTIEKQGSYIAETAKYIIPMLKSSRKKWTQQEAAYQNIKHVLLSQMELVEVIIKTEKAKK